MKIWNKKNQDTIDVLKMVSPIRKVMPRIGTLKLYHLIKEKLELNHLKIGRDKLFYILRNENLLISKKKVFTKTTNSFHRFRKYKNIAKTIDLKRPEQVWVSDITYIKTQEGYQYLSLVTDAYYKKIMGYHVAQNLKKEGPVMALKMAIKNRIYPSQELVHHSDRGIQYCSEEYISLLTSNQITPSMTEAYDPYENAIAERVNGILKDEFEIDNGLQNHSQAQTVIANTIKTYNNLRPHFSCQLKTPNHTHQQQNIIRKTWKKNHQQKIINKNVKTTF